MFKPIGGKFLSVVYFRSDGVSAFMLVMSNLLFEDHFVFFRENVFMGKIVKCSEIVILPSKFSLIFLTHYMC